MKFIFGIFVFVLVSLLAAPALAQQSGSVDIVEVVKKMNPGGASTIHFIPESSFEAFYKEDVESVRFADGRLEIVKRSISYPSLIPAVNCSLCDWSRRRVWKEIWGVKDGRLALLEVIEGKIIPAQAERVEWPRP